MATTTATAIGATTVVAAAASMAPETSIASAADSGNKFDKAAAAEQFEKEAEKRDTAARVAHVQQNPRDSMKSTWRTSDRSKWSPYMWVYEILGINYSFTNREIPVHKKTDKMPYVPHSEAHKWILAHALWPLVLHQLYIWIAGKNLPTIVAVLFYVFSFHFNAIHEIHSHRELGHQYGFLDGEKKRDDVPDAKIATVIGALNATATIRPMISVLMAYRSTTSPLLFTPWVPLEIGLYTVTLDFYYYWYHRILHENDALWKHHRTHHLTKHPTTLLSLYADGIQEVFDIIGIPILTYFTLRVMGMPMSFSDWWLCQQYVVWVELWGHSGLRIMATTPTTATPLLKMFDAELVTEDHDLHHRKGWKNSHNYGKQTRLWDRIFGTCHERYETLEENIDWNHAISLPLWGGEFK